MTAELFREYQLELWDSNGNLVKSIPVADPIHAVYVLAKHCYTERQMNFSLATCTHDEMTDEWKFFTPPFPEDIQ